MLKLLKALEHKESNDTSLLNDVRKIIENIFDECGAKGFFEAAVKDTMIENVDYVVIHLYLNIFNV